MVTTIFVIYGLILLYGAGAFFQRSTSAHFIASGVMTIALILHSCVMTLLFSVGVAGYGAVWFAISASGNTTQADVDAIEQFGTNIANNSTLIIAFVCIVALLLLAFAIIHLIIGLRIRSHAELKYQSINEF